MLSMRDVKILSIFSKDSKTTPFKAYNIVEIENIYNNSAKGGNISTATIRRSIKSLLEEELIAYGYKKINEKTYYITEKGSDLINSLK